jgi:hypothetical protein
MNKQETLEEAMDKNGYHDEVNDTMWREGVKFGAKWQAERMYSEEEVIELLEYIRKNFYDTGSKWHTEPDTDYTSKELVEQFKKK